MTKLFPLPDAAMHLEPLDTNREPIAALAPVRADLDAAAWVASNRRWLDAQLESLGAVVFRRCGIDSVERFRRFAASVCTLHGDYGDLPREEEAPAIYRATPYPARLPILFHNEASHTRAWPLRILFFCIQAARAGGETTLADGREVLRRLEPALRRRFEDGGLLYVRNFVDCFDVTWQAFFRTNDRDAVARECGERGIEHAWTEMGLRTRAPARAIARHPRSGDSAWFNQIELFHPSRLDPKTRRTLERLYGVEGLPRNVTFRDGDAIDDAAVAEIGRAYRDAARCVSLEAGDVLVVDNMLVAHGRRPFLGERRVAVAMGDIQRATDA